MTRIFLLPVLVFFLSCSVSRNAILSPAHSLLSDSSLINAHVGIQVYDASAKKIVYSYQANKYFVPASNTKIPTSYVAMKYLGDSLETFRYAVSGDSIFIQPAGDPVFLHPDFPFQKGFELLKSFQYLSIERTNFQDFLGSGWSWNDYKEGYMAQRSDLPVYGNVLRIKWTRNELSVTPSFFWNNTKINGNLTAGYDVSKPWEQNNFFLSPGRSTSSVIPFRPDLNTIKILLSDTLKKVVTDHAEMKSYPHRIFSYPTDSMLKPLMHRSDNFFAEQTLLMAAKKLTGSFQLMRLIDTVMKTDFRDLPQKPRWVDGSGLSRYNLFTPSSLVMILEKMKNDFGMERIREVFPGANEGTLSGYYTSYGGRFYAKTGTLSGVVALSGFMTTRSGKEFIFSVLINNHQSTSQQVRRAVEKYLSSVMENH